MKKEYKELLVMLIHMVLAIIFVTLCFLLVSGCNFCRREADNGTPIKIRKGDYNCPTKDCGSITIQDMFGKHYCPKCKSVWRYVRESEDW